VPQETERLIADPAPGISAIPHEDNLRYFDVAIEGPSGSPFEGAFYKTSGKEAPPTELWSDGRVWWNGWYRWQVQA
jgi:hypothetical protein